MLQTLPTATSFYCNTEFVPTRIDRKIHLSASKIDKFYDLGVLNIPGIDWLRPEKVNQDAWFQDDDRRNGRHSIFGILDGHGKLGHDLSKYFASKLAVEIRKQLKTSLTSIPELEDRLEKFAGFNYRKDLESYSDPQIALINAFHAVHWSAMLDKEIKTGRNGSTCIACLIDMESRECHVAYVGDSRGICFNIDSTAISVIAKETTIDIPGERKRIDVGEGSVRGNNVFYGPVGIAMTRALGDAVMLRAGVIPTPLVNSLNIQEGDIIVLATDGIWDVLTNENVRDIVMEQEDSQAAADAIAKRAKERWIGDLPIMDEMKVDDITVMVLSWR